tara:strand:+ start:344 stop:517 length:174 start_codon:yes stop_codon:yes gene_type:complete
LKCFDQKKVEKKYWTENRLFKEINKLITDIDFLQADIKDLNRDVDDLKKRVLGGIDR